MKVVQSLRRVPLFAGLSDDALARLAAVVGRRTFAPGELVLLEGEPCRWAYFVVQGQARVYRSSPSGREQVLVQLGPGESFNTVPILAHGVNHASVQAVSQLTVFAVDGDDLRRLASECPELALALLEDMAKRLDHLTELVHDLALRTVRGRLARFLLENAGADHVDRQWTQDEIASRLGTVRDMVGRTLRAFVDGGLVRMDRQRIVLLDREGLQAEAYE